MTTATILLALYAASVAIGLWLIVHLRRRFVVVRDADVTGILVALILFWPICLVGALLWAAIAAIVAGVRRIAGREP